MGIGFLVCRSEEIRTRISSFGSLRAQADFITEQEIPWDELAFPVVREMLKEFLEDRKAGEYPIRSTVIEYPRR